MRIHKNLWLTSIYQASKRDLKTVLQDYPEMPSECPINGAIL